MGTEAAVQNQGSHRLTEKHRGQGLRNRQSCDATVLTLTTGRRRRSDRGTERRRETAGSPGLKGSPAKVVSHPWWVYRDHSVMPYSRRLPVPTVEHLSTGLRSRQDPEDQRKLGKGYRNSVTESRHKFGDIKHQLYFLPPELLRHLKQATLEHDGSCDVTRFEISKL